MPLGLQLLLLLMLVCGHYISGGIVTATTGSFSGTVTANAFSGDGSELTGVRICYCSE